MSQNLEQIYIIIPSLNPDNKLLTLLEELKKKNFQNILLVNDGSDESCRSFFDIAKEKYKCKVISHSVNLGKGRALKNAFNHILTEYKDCSGAVTVDSDGQHKADDILRCAQAVSEHKDTLIMGCRDFSRKTGNIPFRSRFGNVMTHKVLRFLCGISVSDTQTGLRGFSRSLMKQFLSTKGERFEYEMNMILDTKEKNIPVFEIPIHTLYINENQSSHFNPLLDSMRIYKSFLKYIIASLSSFLIDIALFSVFVYFFKPSFEKYYIEISVVSARVISAVFNYFINRNKVFKNTTGSPNTLPKYAALCVILLAASTVLTKQFFRLTGLNETFIKTVVDSILFLLSYGIQRNWIFGGQKNGTKNNVA